MKAREYDDGDFELMRAFIKSLISKEKADPLTNAKASLESHLMAFAAHKSRLNNCIIDMKEFREQADIL